MVGPNARQFDYKYLWIC